MKKILSLFLIFVLVLSLSTALFSCGSSSNTETGTTNAAGDTNAADAKPANSAEFFIFTEAEFEGVKYYELSGISESGKKQTVLEIPETYNDLTVLALNSKCFEGCDKLETLTIHSNIRELYANLFPGCKSLKTINLDFGALVKAINEDATVADAMCCATAADGSLTGSNSIIEGLDEKKVKFVFTDSDAYDYFSTDYTWAVFASIMTLSK